MDNKNNHDRPAQARSSFPVEEFSKLNLRSTCAASVGIGNTSRPIDDMALDARKYAQQSEMLRNLMFHISHTPYSVGSWHSVKVTHINNPGSFYIRPIDYEIYMSALQKPGSAIEPSDLYIGNVIIFSSKILRSCARGQILFYNKEEYDKRVDLFAIDYGFIEQDVPISLLFKTLHTIPVPPLAKHCELELCKPRGGIWQQGTINAMKHYIRDEKTHIVIKNKMDDLLTIKVHNSCPEDVSSMLTLVGHSTYCFDNRTSINRFSCAPAPKQAFYNIQKYEAGVTVYVRTQSWQSLKQFYVADVKNYKKYIEERDNIANFAQQETPVKPDEIEEGTPVCVPTVQRHKYERAIVKSVDHVESTALVQLVDWGDIMEMPLGRIKPLRESFLQHPAAAIYCSIEPKLKDYRRWSHILRTGYPLMIKINSVGDQFSTPNIVEIYEMPESARRAGSSKAK